MPIQNWTEPIYSLQKGENKRANCYFQRWLDYEGSTRSFVKYLNDIWHQPGIDLESHFHRYDIEKNKPPTLSTVLKWSMCDNWEDRKTAYWKDRQDETNKLKIQIHAQQELEIFKLQEKARLLNLEDLVEGLEHGTLNGTQRQAITKSNKDLQDATNRDMGEVKDINQTNMEATVETESKLAHDFNDDVLGVISDAITRRNTNNTG